MESPERHERELNKAIFGSFKNCSKIPRTMS